MEETEEKGQLQSSDRDGRIYRVTCFDSQVNLKIGQFTS